MTARRSRNAAPSRSRLPQLCVRYAAPHETRRSARHVRPTRLEDRPRGPRPRLPPPHPALGHGGEPRRAAIRRRPFRFDGTLIPFRVAAHVLADLGYELCAPRRHGHEPPLPGARYFVNPAAPPYLRYTALVAHRTGTDYAVHAGSLYEIEFAIQLDRLTNDGPA